MADHPAPPIVLFGIAFHPQGQIGVAVAANTIQEWVARGGNLLVIAAALTFIVVPSMMPRPVLVSNFNLTYRKIPVMASGKEIYIDTSLILEAIAHHPSYPPSKTHPPLHPDEATRTLTRLLSSHYTDRPLFRLTTGLIPQVVWQTSFAVDRAELIGHKLNATKLGAKIPKNLAALDTYLSILEPLFASGQKWFLGSSGPTGADISLYYQLYWGQNISKGDGIQDLTGGGTGNGFGEGMDAVFNQDRYPALTNWFQRVGKFFATLPNVETRIERDAVKAVEDVMSGLNAAEQTGPVPLLPTPVPQHSKLDGKNGLEIGARVSVAPDDTGRDDPTLGTLVALSTQEVVIVPDAIDGRGGRVEDVRVHFPRVGFIVKPLGLGDQEAAEVRVTRTSSKAKL